MNRREDGARQPRLSRGSLTDQLQCGDDAAATAVWMHVTVALLVVIRVCSPVRTWMPLHLSSVRG